MNEKLLYAGIIVFSTFISAVSQVMLKKAAMKNHETRLGEYLNPLVIGAYLIFVVSTFLTVYSYRGLEVSQGTLLETTGYLFIFAFDVIIFHERMTPKKILGTALILAGIAVAVLL